MRNRLQPVILIMAIQTAAWAAEVPSREKLWELKLGEISGELPGQAAAEISVFYMSFSPDGQRIAAVVGRSSAEESVLILDAADPRKNRKIFNINPGMWFAGQRILWSPSSQHIILGTILARVSDGTACFFSPYKNPNSTRYFFVGSDQVATNSTHSRGLSFYGLECQPTGTWNIDGMLAGYIMDASAERGLVCIRQTVYERWSQAERKWKASSRAQPSVAVVDVNSMGTVLRLPIYSLDPLVQFADSGKVVCEGRGTKVRCWEVNSGKQLAEIKAGYHSTLDFSTAYRARRFVTSHYGTIAGVLADLMGTYHENPNPNRVIWDIGSGEKLVSWRSASQSVLIPGPYDQGPSKEPCRFAISPDGEYIVEGGAGILSLYRVRP